MVKHSEVMKLREEEISRLIECLSRQTDEFENPKIVMIGGYALRAFTSLSRNTRDCDLDYTDYMILKIMSIRPAI